MSAIAFPTDAITLGHMRRKEPALFTWTGLDSDAIANIDAVSTLKLECRLARMAFAKACGIEDPHPEVDRGAFTELLDEAYQEYGISTGSKMSQELIKCFEKTAAAQADKWRGTRPR